MEEKNRTYETMEIWDLIASVPQKIHEMTSQQRQEQFGNQWYIVQTTTGGSNTLPTRQHLEVGQAHRARMGMDYNTQRTTAGQAGSSSSPQAH